MYTVQQDYPATHLAALDKTTKGEDKQMQILRSGVFCSENTVQDRDNNTPHKCVCTITSANTLMISLMQYTEGQNNKHGINRYSSAQGQESNQGEPTLGRVLCYPQYDAISESSSNSQNTTSTAFCFFAVAKMHR